MEKQDGEIENQLGKLVTYHLQFPVVTSQLGLISVFSVEQAASFEQNEIQGPDVKYHSWKIPENEPYYRP